MRRLLLAAPLLLLSIFPAQPGWCEIFYYVDPAGVYHFSDTPTDVRYRPLLSPNSNPQSWNLELSEQDLWILRTIELTALQFRLDPDLIKAVVKVESDFNPRAISSAGAMGLMQLMPATATRWSVTDPFDPEENIWGGVRYLRYLMDLFDGRLSHVLAAYHAGEDRVSQHNGIPPISATQRYVQKVLKYYRLFRDGNGPFS